MSKTLKRGKRRGRKGGTKKSKSTTTSSIITPPKPRYLSDGRDPRLYRRNLEPSENLETISDVPKKMSRKFKLKPTRAATVEFIEVSKTPTPEELSYIPKIKRSKKIKSKKKRKKNKENIEFIIVEDF